MSGPRVERFAGGWALPVPTLGRAHYFRWTGPGRVVSICGSVSYPAAQLFGPGTFIRCKRCTTLSTRQPVSQAG